MFKKPRDSDTKTEKKYGGKEIKACISLINTRFGSSTSSTNTNTSDDNSSNNIAGLSKKSSLSLKFFVQPALCPPSIPQESGLLVSGENDPLFIVNYGGKGFPNDSNKSFTQQGLGTTVGKVPCMNDIMIPTLLTLWRHSGVEFSQFPFQSPSWLKLLKEAKSNPSTLNDSNSKNQMIKNMLTTPTLNIPKLFIFPEVTQFILNGADLMLPGLSRPSTNGHTTSSQHNKDTLAELIRVKSSWGSLKSPIVSVHVEGNPFAIALGYFQLSETNLSNAASGSASSGICVKILHRYGDSLWQKFPVEVQTPTGFGVDIGLGGDKKGVGRVFESGVLADSNGDAGVVDPEDLEVNLEEDSQENAESSESKVDQENKEDDGEENHNHDNAKFNTEQHNDESNDDVNDSDTDQTPRKNANNLKNEKHRKGGNKKNQKNQESKNNQQTVDQSTLQAQQKAMDKLLLGSLLQALHTILPKNQEKTLLPMDFNQMYANYIRPSRPNNTSVDIKLSSYKKLKSFFEYLESTGVCLVSLNKEKTKVTGIYRNCSMYTEFTQGDFRDYLDAESIENGEIFNPIAMAISNISGVDKSSSATEFDAKELTNLAIQAGLHPTKGFASIEVRSLLQPAYRCLHYEEVLKIDNVVGSWLLNMITNDLASSSSEKEKNSPKKGNLNTDSEKNSPRQQDNVNEARNVFLTRCGMILHQNHKSNNASNETLYARNPQSIMDLLREVFQRKNMLLTKRQVDLKRVPMNVSCVLAKLNSKFAANQEKKDKAVKAAKQQKAANSVAAMKKSGLKMAESDDENDDNIDGYLDISSDEGGSDNEATTVTSANTNSNSNLQNQNQNFPALGTQGNPNTAKGSGKGNNNSISATTPRPATGSGSNDNNVPLPPNFQLSIEHFARLLALGGTQVNKPCHRIIELTALNESSIKFKEAPPPKIRVRTEKKKNHNCTIIFGLHLYKYDLAKCLDYFKRQVSASAGHLVDLDDSNSNNNSSNNNNNIISTGTTYNPNTVQEILLQGFWDADVCKMLVDTFKIPAKSVENMAESRKKDMKQKTGGYTKGRVGVVKA